MHDRRRAIPVVVEGLDVVDEEVMAEGRVFSASPQKDGFSKQSLTRHARRNAALASRHPVKSSPRAIDGTPPRRARFALCIKTFTALLSKESNSEWNSNARRDDRVYLQDCDHDTGYVHNGCVHLT